MKLFAKLFAVGFATISLTSSTIAIAQQNAPISGGSPITVDEVPLNCQKQTIKQGTRETYKLCQLNGKPIEIEYEYFDKITTITTFSYRDGQLARVCENQLGSCTAFANNRATAAWIQGERMVRFDLTNPEDAAKAAEYLKRSQMALKLFKLSNNRSAVPKETKLQNVREYFLAVPDEFIPNLNQKVRTQSIVSDGKGSSITEGYLEFNIPDNTLPSEYRDRLISKKGQVRLFKHQAGHIILGMLVTFCEKPGICQSQPQFLEYKAGVWRKINDTILPKISDKEAAKLASQSVNAPKLPAGQKITTYYGLASADKLDILHGTCLDKTCTSLSILQSYTWNGRKFVVYQYPESP
jgi:hypothetical protein